MKDKRGKREMRGKMRKSKEEKLKKIGRNVKGKILVTDYRMGV